MMFRQADPIEAEVLDHGYPLDHAAIDVGPGGGVIGLQASANTPGIVLGGGSAQGFGVGDDFHDARPVGLEVLL